MTEQQKKALNAVIQAAKELEWVIAFNSESEELSYIIIGKKDSVKEITDKLDNNS